MTETTNETESQCVTVKYVNLVHGGDVFEATLESIATSV